MRATPPPAPPPPRALIALDSQKHLAAIATALASADEPDALREKLATYLAELRTAPACKPITDAMSSASLKLQQSFADLLAYLLEHRAAK